MTSDTVFLLIAALIVAIAVFIFVYLTGNHRHNFDKEAYQASFLKIENKLKKDSPDSYTVALLSADKLLDRAMVEAGFHGSTMGERLKKSGNTFSELNSVWHAHKLRNSIAHEPNFELSYRQTRNALDAYKQALKDLGAI